MTAFCLCLLHQTDAMTGVHLLRLLDDQTVLDKFTDGTTRVGITDCRCLIGVEPDFSFACLKDTSSKATLEG